MMKLFKPLALTLSFLLLVTMLAGCAGHETVTFPDDNLETAIKTALGKQSEEEILVSELANLTVFSASSSGITDLSGIEYCTNLIELDLSNNQISNIYPLSTLTNLMVLKLDMNRIIDISALSKLTSLNWLNLNNNDIGNLEPLVANSGLGEGDNIFLLGNEIMGEVEHTGPWQVVTELEDRGAIVHYSGSW